MPNSLESFWNRMIYSDANDGKGDPFLDNHEVDHAYIRQLGLTYKGRDRFGRIWVDDSGREYRAIELQTAKNPDNEGVDNQPGQNVKANKNPQNDVFVKIPGPPPIPQNTYNAVTQNVAVNPFPAINSWNKVTQPKLPLSKLPTEKNSADTIPASNDNDDNQNLKTFKNIFLRN